jgi:hypothetical protein
MKRVFLTADPTDLSSRDPALVRAAAVALARYATDADGAGHREVGDPVHEEVTEGRYKQWLDARTRGDAWAQGMIYSSCGDPVHWMLRNLGCRDESLVNRSDDGGEHPWAAGRNIAMLGASKFVRKPGRDVGPSPGDAVFVMNQYGGHVCTVTAWREPDPDKATTQDYGQPCGKQRTKQIASAPHFTLDGHPVLWWLDVTLVPLAESAIVPDDFEGGVLDTNPYPEPDVAVYDTEPPPAA